VRDDELTLLPSHICQVVAITSNMTPIKVKKMIEYSVRRRPNRSLHSPPLNCPRTWKVANRAPQLRQATERREVRIDGKSKAIRNR
jgi:hypothetical protein